MQNTGSRNSEDLNYSSHQTTQRAHGAAGAAPTLRYQSTDKRVKEREKSGLTRLVANISHEAADEQEMFHKAHRYGRVSPKSNKQERNSGSQKSLKSSTRPQLRNHGTLSSN